jgi:hypothetical protein
MKRKLLKHEEEGRRHSSDKVNHVNGCINWLLTIKLKKGGFKILKKPIYLILPCLLILFAIAFTATGCVKRHNCTEGITGTWQYLEEPIDVYKTYPNCNKKRSKEIVATLTSPEGYLRCQIGGYVPPKYRSSTPVKVRIIVKRDNEGHIETMDLSCPETHKLKCIERE